LRTRTMFYGWFLLGASCFVDVATAPGHSTGVNVFVEPLLKEFSLTRTSFSLHYVCALFGSAALLPLAGIAVERGGVRATAIAASFAFGSALLCLSRAQSATGFALCLFAARFFGPEVMYLCSCVAVNSWFVRLRGRATAVRGIGEAFFIGFPRFGQPMIAAYGWRGAYARIALGAAALGALGGSALRGKPEEYGLLPDGTGGDGGGRRKAPTSTKLRLTVGSGRAEEPRFSGPEALRLPLFWLLVGVESMFSFAWSGLNIHIFDVFGQLGLTAAESAGMSVRMGSSIWLSMTVTGLVIDRYSVRQRLRFFALLYALLGLILLALVSGPLHAGEADADAGAPTARVGLWCVCYGAVVGAQFCVRSMVAADVFGRDALPRTSSVWNAVATATSGAGPLLFGYSRDSTGGYRACVLPLVGGLLLGSAVLAVSGLPARSAAADNSGVAED